MFPKFRPVSLENAAFFSSLLELIRSGVVGETQAGFSITQLAYRLGDAKLTDVIFQQRSLIDGQLAELAAQAELAIAEANLDLALGTRKQ